MRRLEAIWLLTGGFSTLISDAQLRRMFDLLYANMQPINPVDGGPDEVFRGWREAWMKRIREEDIRVVWEERGGELRGFLIYSVDAGSGVVSIDELQVRAEHQRDGVTLRRLLGPFLDDIAALPCRLVRTYANKLNPVSPQLADKLGFEIYEETERGWRYRIEKALLAERLLRWR